LVVTLPFLLAPLAVYAIIVYACFIQGRCS
jgi:hypothetical protein